MKKVCTGTIIVLAVALAIVIVITQTKEEPKEIRIGAILPLTGNMAKFGESFKRGIDLALEEINNAGGIQGKKLLVIYEDDGGEGKQAISAFRKLIALDKVQSIIGGIMSSTAMPIAPIAEKKKVVIISPTATAPALSEFKDYFFRVQPSDNYEGKVMAEFAYKQLEAENVGVFYVNNDWGKGLSEVFENEFTQLGGRISSEENYELDHTDFKTQITKIKATNPSYLYLLGYLKELSIILRQMHELGVKSRILSAYSFHDPKLLEIGGEIVENAIFTMPTYDPKSKDPVIVEFAEKYKAKYDNEPDMFTAHSYDCMKILGYVIQKGAFTGVAISKELHKVVDYPGATGRNTFDENGDVVKPLKFFTVQNGQFTPYSD